MGRYGTEYGLAKAARHVPQFLDGKLHEAYVVVIGFRSRDRIVKLKIHHTVFDACQIFLLCGSSFQSC